MTNDLSVISKRYKDMRATLMPKVGALILKFIDDRFVEQGWKDSTLTPWQARKNNKDPGRSILIGKGTAHLRRSYFIVGYTDHSVTAGSDLPYAKPHNEGLHERVNVKAHTRRTKAGKQVDVKSYSMMMNLPQRKMIGESATLRAEVRELIKDEVKSCFK